MGGNQTKSITYSSSIPESDEIEFSPIFRHPEAQDLQVSPTIYSCSLLYPLFQKIVSKIPQKPFIGYRLNNSSNFEWLTYNRTCNLTNNISKFIDSLSLKQNFSLSSDYSKPLALLGFYGQSKVEWLLILIACLRINVVTVGLFDNFESLVKWTEELDLRYLCTYSEKLEVLRQGISSGILKLEIVIVYDFVSKECKDDFFSIGVKLLTLDEIIKGDGVSSPVVAKPEDPCFLCLTSGTSGPGKFVVVTHANLMSNLAACLYLAQTITSEDTYLSYLNFSLLGEVLFVFLVMASEGRVGLAFEAKDFAKDAALLKPTMMLVIPRILEFIHEMIKRQVDSLSGVSKSLYQKALAAKLHNYESSGTLKHKIWDSLVFSKARKVLGGNVKLIVTGLTICPPEIVKFIRIVMSCDVMEGYGLIETGIANLVSRPSDKSTGHIGGPLINIEIKLRYTGNIFEEFHSYYGELYIKGPQVSTRYYGSAIRFEQGWMPTGDLVALIPDTGAFVFIDRLENIQKSRSGRCVCIQKLESLYRQSKCVAQICCFVNQQVEGLIAVVVPNLEFVRTKWKTKKVERFCNSSEFTDLLLRDFLVIERIHKLKEHEKVVKVIVELEPWVSEDLVTQTLKIRRFKLRERYESQILAAIKEYLVNY